jgi:hypothetical protein
LKGFGNISEETNERVLTYPAKFRNLCTAVKKIYNWSIFIGDTPEGEYTNVAMKISLPLAPSV